MTADDNNNDDDDDVGDLDESDFDPSNDLSPGHTPSIPNMQPSVETIKRVKTLKLPQH